MEMDSSVSLNIHMLVKSNATISLFQMRFGNGLLKMGHFLLYVNIKICNIYNYIKLDNFTIMNANEKFVHYCESADSFIKE